MKKTSPNLQLQHYWYHKKNLNKKNLINKKNQQLSK
jgi:hypothetical protein